MTTLLRKMKKPGVEVGSGDVDGDGVDEVLAGSGPGAAYAPEINVYAYDGSNFVLVDTFFAYPGQDLSHGVKATIGAFQWVD